MFKRGGKWVFAAPAHAARLTVAGDSGDAATAAVERGQAVLDAAATATLAPGEYAAEWELADGSLVDGPRFTVTLSLKTDGVEATYKRRTLAERMVAALSALVETNAASGELTYSTPDGLSVSFESRAELNRELAQWRHALAKERGAFKRVTSLA